MASMLASRVVFRRMAIWKAPVRCLTTINNNVMRERVGADNKSLLRQKYNTASMEYNINPHEYTLPPEDVPTSSSTIDYTPSTPAITYLAATNTSNDSTTQTRARTTNMLPIHTNVHTTTNTTANSHAHNTTVNTTHASNNTSQPSSNTTHSNNHITTTNITSNTTVPATTQPAHNLSVNLHTCEAALVASNSFYRRPLPDTLVAFSSHEGKRRADGEERREVRDREGYSTHTNYSCHLQRHLQ